MIYLTEFRTLCLLQRQTSTSDLEKTIDVICKLSYLPEYDLYLKSFYRVNEYTRTGSL